MALDGLESVGSFIIMRSTNLLCSLMYVLLFLLDRVLAFGLVFLRFIVNWIWASFFGFGLWFNLFCLRIRG